jgi:hypothetical protein
VTEQRQHPRYAIELDASVLWDEDRVVGRTRDLSMGGFCMKARQGVPLSTVCRVQLALVFSENQFSETLELLATVVWSTPVQGGFQLGLKFAPLTGSNRNYLEMFIQFLDGSEDGHDDDDDEE